MTDAIIIESIDVQRAPGIAEPFALPGFRSGINVVTGPNASGKSTTARLIHQLFWKHDRRGDAHVVVRFRLGDDAWMLRRDGRVLACFCNGDARALPLFDELSDETRDRYLLALHDLLSAGDVAFARTIGREIAGGFDLDAAARSLDYQAKPPAPSGMKNDLDRAISSLRQATGHQEQLLAREAELDRLKAEASRANAAQAEIVRLDRIGQVLDAVRSLAFARSSLEAFPEALVRFRGDERELVGSLQKAEDQFLRERNQIKQTLGLAEAQLEDLHLPAGDELDVLMSALAGHLKTLNTAELSAHALQCDRQAALARSEQALGGLTGVIESDRIGAQAIALFDDLAEALEQLDRAASNDAAMEAVAEWIGSVAAPDDLDRIAAGTRALQTWLRAPDRAAQAENAGSSRAIVFIAAIVLVAEAVALGVFVHPALFALLIVPVALIAWLLGRRAPVHDPRADAEQRFARLGIGNPDRWQVDEVEELLDQLQAQASIGSVEYEKSQRWAELGRKRAAAGQTRDAALARAEALEQRIGLDRALSVESARLVRQAIHDATAEVATAADAAGRLLAVEDAHRRALAAFNQQSWLAGVAPAVDAEQAAALLEQLRRRSREAAEAERTLDQATRDLNDRIEPALAEIAAQRQGLRERIGVDDLDEIAPLAESWEAWRAAKQRFDEAGVTLLERRNQLPGDLSLDDWTSERVEQERQEQEFLVGSYEMLMREIGAIELELRQAKQGHSVEQALDAEQRARSKLLARREEDIARSLGALLVETVRQQSDEANLPEVARTARQLFARITRGRYELKFIPGEPPAFRAFDTITGISQPLDELSSATRVQLLLAVRAAFVEANERSAKLPLLLDETLANADESRAEAMIEAAFDLAADGRQLFYFTAQRDEVEKWRSIGAAHPETPLTVIDLAAARHIPSQIRNDWLDLPRAERVRPPEPDGMSRAAYRDLIGVAPLNFWAQSDGDIHLWYLVPDLPSLHRLLADDVSTWGQLKGYIEQSAAGQLGLDGAEIARIRARAKLCGAIRSGARIGRGAPATAAVLDASGAISTAFIERCVGLLDECAGDAQEFLTQLRAKAIGGFRTDKIEQLEQYFRENGHIVDSEPLKPDELAHRVRIELTAEMIDGSITRDDLDQMMGDLAISGIGISRTTQLDRTAAAPALPVP